MKKFAVIVAGGAGLRMGTSTPKQFLLVQGKPVLWHTLHTFFAAFDDLDVVLVLPAAYITMGTEIANTFPSSQRIQITEGGATRFESVKNGLKLVEKNTIVFVHDAVRCLVTTALIQRCYATALEKGNAIPAIASVDSVRMITADGNSIIDRNQLRIIQTPQTFYSDDLLEAFHQPYQESFTDEAAVVEKSGIAINLIEGEVSNIKITTSLDLLLAEKLLDARKLQE